MPAGREAGFRSPARTSARPWTRCSRASRYHRNRSLRSAAISSGRAATERPRCYPPAPPSFRAPSSRLAGVPADRSWSVGWLVARVGDQDRPAPPTAATAFPSQRGRVVAQHRLTNNLDRRESLLQKLVVELLQREG